jgi:sugar phosphate isomerase/epimerase
MRTSQQDSDSAAASLGSRLSINQLMLPGSTFEEDVDRCLRVGASGLGISEAKLGHDRDRSLVERLTASGLRASLCTAETPSILPVEVFGGPSDPRERVDRLIASIERLGPFRPSHFLTLTGADATLEHDEQRDIAVNGYREIAAAAASVGAQVGVEPIRSEHASGVSLISSLSEAAQFVAEIDAPNVGIVFDVWHHWDSPSLLEDIATFADRFSIVQLGDAPLDPSPGINRAIPGEGRIPLDTIFFALERAGYGDWYDVELLSDPDEEGSVDRLDIDEVLDRAKQGLQLAWANSARGEGK